MEVGPTVCDGCVALRADCDSIFLGLAAQVTIVAHRFILNPMDTSSLL